MMTRGGRNLLLMGTFSIVVAAVTTGTSLAIYHNSGDIYLDRSRPGYLPDEDEIEEDEKFEDEPEFPSTGAVTTEVLEEYLTGLKKEIQAIDGYEDPFGAAALSDEELGI